MTATAAALACPKCSGAMWDNRIGKTNPKAPDFKCKDKACDGVIWPPRGPKNGAPPASKSASSKPDAQLPPLLQNQEAEDAAELAGKIGAKKPTMREAYKQLTEWVISDIAPIYDTEYGEGAYTPDVVAACVATLFIQACHAGKVE